MTSQRPIPEEGFEYLDDGRLGPEIRRFARPFTFDRDRTLLPNDGPYVYYAYDGYGMGVTDEQYDINDLFNVYSTGDLYDVYDVYDAGVEEGSNDNWIRRQIHGIANALITVQMAFSNGVSTVDDFTELWMSSRPRRLMRAGLLPVVLAAAFVLAMVLARDVPRAALIDRYRLDAALASVDGDDVAARLWLQKVTWLNPDDPDYQYRLALGAEKNGDLNQAKQIMRRLAPDDRAGHGPAHFWRAQQTVAGTHRVPRSRVPILRHHLRCAAAHSNQNAEAAEMLAQLEMQAGDINAAISALESVVPYYPDFKLMLARLHQIQGDGRRASSLAASGLVIFERRVEKDPDSVADRVQLAKLLTFQGHCKRAVLVLQDGAARLHRDAAGAPSREGEDDRNTALAQLRSELSNTLIAWHDGFRRESPLDCKSRLHILQLAVNTVPTDRRVLERLALLAAEGQHNAKDARGALSGALANGTAPGTVHLLLSLDAKNRNNRLAEEAHLRLALALNPRLAAAANNLAWLLVHDDSPDLDGALKLVQQAADVAPDHPEIRATRGVIYGKLGRTEEAIVDLESALAMVGSRADIHSELAGLYKELGDGELAIRHRSRATLTLTSETGPAG